MNEQITDITNKSQYFENELKNLNSFDKKIEEIFLNEFEDHICDILNLDESEFFQKLVDKVDLILEDKFDKACLNNQTLINILIIHEKLIHKHKYKPISKALRTKLDEYYSTTSYRSLGSKGNKESNDKKLPLTDIRKHCRFTKSKAIHSICGESNFLPVLDDKQQNIEFLICLTCNMPYFATAILLFCQFCNIEYYSCIQPKNNCQNKELATWEKYHCSAMVNDFLRCIKCQNGILYLDLITNSLTCDICEFSADPLSILWTCYICNNDFSSNAKIYNPLEFKLLKTAINNAILYKVHALPNTPCCNLPISVSYFHKKECKGEIYLGEYNKNSIVVCEKCKMMNYFDKFVWTCPICLKRFNNSLDEYGLKYNDTKYTNENTNSNSNENTTDTKALNFEIKKSKTEQLHLTNNKPSNFRTDTKIKEKISTTVNKTSHDRLGLKENQNKPIKPIKQIQFIGPKGEEKNAIFEKKNENESSPTRIFKRTSNSSSNVNTNTNTIKSNKSGSIENNEANDNLYQLHDRSPLNTYNKTSKTSSINSNNKESRKESTVTFADEKEEVLFQQLHIKKEEFEDKEDCLEKIKEFNMDDYKIIKRIGEGTFAKIYLAEDKNSKRYCIKKLIANDEIEVQKYSKEYELMHSYEHNNILKIHGKFINKLDVTTYVIYILTELAEKDWGMEIKARAKKKLYYEEKELVSILKQLTDCMLHLQKNNISHRDIKPQNILIFKGIYKLADFGEAKKVTNKKNKMNTIRGTELYMSPQLFNGFNNNMKNVFHNSYKSDIYSLGLCFVYSATLNHDILTEIRNCIEVEELNEILREELQKKYSDQFVDILERMLDIDEVSRYDFIELKEAIYNNFS